MLDDFNFFGNFYNSGFFKSVFSGGYKFRPVSNSMLWLAAVICQGNIYIYGYLNVFFDAIAAFLVYLLIKDISKSEYSGGLGVVLYIVSRFSYYQITTQLGVMETTSTILFIILIRNLYVYIEKKESRYYYYALLSYMLCSMSHERYTILLPVLLYAWLVSRKKNKQIKQNKSKDYWMLLLTICVFIIIMVIFKVMVDDVLMGTGAQSVSDTFSISGVLVNILKSIGYLFGIAVNSQDVYLSMIEWAGYSVLAKISVVISTVAAIIIVVMGICDILKNKDDLKKKKELSIVGLFVLSAGAMILISSVTIRVELRWMYAPYVAAIALLIYMICIEANRKSINLKKILFVIYVLGMVVFNVFCRNYYGKLYYWQNYTIANALTDSTFGKYGSDMYSKSWVIITDTQITNAYDELMKQYDVYNEYNLEVQVVNSVNDLKEIEHLEEKEVLYFDKSSNEFIEITNMLKEYLLEAG